MIFATGNIYRETGTASREVEDKQYLKRENRDKYSLRVAPTVDGRFV